MSMLGNEIEKVTPILHGIARVQIWLAKADGHAIEKPLARYDDMVAEAIQYGSMGFKFSPEIAEDSIRETFLRCVKTDVGFAGKRFNETDYKWMVPE